MASIQPVSELPVLTSSFAHSQGSSRAFAVLDVYLNQRNEGCVYLGLGMKSTHELNTEIILLTHFAATLMGYENKIIYLDR